MINSTITYLTRSRAEVPSWAVSPLFTQERALSERLSDLQPEIDALQEELRPFQEARNLAFLSEYGFEEAVPKFVTSHLGIPTYRDEKYKEDFWLLNSQSQEIVIAEAKSHTRGLKRSDIYSLHNHRESNGLDDNFPALLVINVHLNAKSWKQKIRSIDPQDYKAAASHHILVVRIEDLLFFWNAITEGRQSLDRLLEIILHENGWLQVEVNGDFVLHK